MEAVYLCAKGIYFSKGTEIPGGIDLLAWNQLSEFDTSRSYAERSPDEFMPLWRAPAQTQDRRGALVCLFADSSGRAGVKTTKWCHREQGLGGWGGFTLYVTLTSKSPGS